MNIEEAINILTQKADNNLSNHFNNTRFFEAINTLLKAYEKEKEKNKELNFKYQARQEIEKDRTKKDYFKENHKETIAECYSKCSELWKNKIFTKIKEIENECKKCRFKKSEICEELCQNSQCVQGECLKVLHSLSR